MADHPLSRTPVGRAVSASIRALPAPCTRSPGTPTGRTRQLRRWRPGLALRARRGGMSAAPAAARAVCPS